MEKISNQDSGYFQGSGGLKLFFRAHRVDNPKAIFILVHGLGEHSGRYEKFNDFFTQQNFSVYSYDLRGHGLSAGGRGHILNFNDYLLDLKEFHVLVKNNENNGDIFLLGHSLGGLIVLRYAQEFRQNLKGIVLSSPAIKSLISVPDFKIKLANFLSNILPEITLRNRINPDYLSRNSQVVANYQKDKLVHNRITVRSFTEVTQAMLEVYKKAELLKIPCLLLQAGDDKIVSAQAASSFFKRIKASAKQLNIYPGFYHELFNEAGYEKIFQDIYNWILTLA